MKLKLEKIKHVVTEQTLKDNPDMEKEGIKLGHEIVIAEHRVFELICACGKKGGEVRFPEEHGRKSDKELEKEMQATYNHMCHDCCCKDRHNPTHPKFGKEPCKTGTHA